MSRLPPGAPSGVRTLHTLMRIVIYVTPPSDIRYPSPLPPQRELRFVEAATRRALGRAHSAHFGQCDVTQPIDAPSNARVAAALAGGTRLYIASYVVAENSVALRESGFVFFEELMRRAPAGSVCLVLETTHRQFPELARAAWRGGGPAVAVACPRVRSNRGFSLVLHKRQPAETDTGGGDAFGPGSEELAALFARFEQDDERQRERGGGRGERRRRVREGRAVAPAEDAAVGGGARGAAATCETTRA